MLESNKEEEGSSLVMSLGACCSPSILFFSFCFSRIFQEKAFNSKLSGNEFYYTA
jgi:hypothetical protein